MDAGTGRYFLKATEFKREQTVGSFVEEAAQAHEERNVFRLTQASLELEPPRKGRWEKKEALRKESRGEGGSGQSERSQCSLRRAAEVNPSSWGSKWLLTDTGPSCENDFPENKSLLMRSQILLCSPNVKKAFSNLSHLSSAVACLP